MTMPRKESLSDELLRWAPDPEMTAKWLAAMEAAGPANVRDSVLATGAIGPAASVLGIDNYHITKGFAQAWLREQEDAAARRHDFILRLTVWTSLIAAVAAVIAAAPVVIGWFGGSQP